MFKKGGNIRLFPRHKIVPFGLRYLDPTTDYTAMSLSSTIDLSQLEQMTGGDQQFLIQVLELIHRQSPDVLQKMQADLQSDDLAALGAAAHKFKSSIHVLGNSEWVQLLKQIELTATDQQDRKMLTCLLKEFEHVCDDILDRISDELDRLRKNS